MKNKKGAASFYVVAFATLVLLIAAMSFASVIISELTRTSNDDLAQSAYDSAMAGVEDAKLAYYNYLKCDNTEASGCSDFKAALDKVNSSGTVEEEQCDMVGTFLGRISDDDTNGVEVKEEEANNMQQWYTCATIKTVVDDYQSELSTSPYEIIKPKFADGKSANDVASMTIEWYERADLEGKTTKYVADDRFDVTQYTPPIISVAIVQGENGDSLNDYWISSNNGTNRGMVYLVPTGEDEFKRYSVDAESASFKKAGCNFSGPCNINDDSFIKSNNQEVENKAFLVACDFGDKTSTYLCSAKLDLPKPIGDNANRGNNAFFVVVANPYGTPRTKFSVSFQGESTTGTIETLKLKDTQIEIDSTGKANDLYKRVKARITPDKSGSGIMGPLMLEDGFTKELTVTSEQCNNGSSAGSDCKVTP